MAILTTIQPVTLRDQIVEQIRVAIIEGELRPEDRITEHELTQKLGVSRTPVREALILLESQGLVGFVPNRGCFVRAFSEQDVEEIFSMRTLLENFAAELIIAKITDADLDHLQALIERQLDAIEEGCFKLARRIDMSFHQYIVELSEHAILIKDWTQIVAQIAALLNARAVAVPEFDERQAITDHGRILEAYRSRELERVKVANGEINSRVARRCSNAIKDLRA